MTKHLFLSYIIEEKTPLYGGSSDYKLISPKCMERGDAVNDSRIECTVHLGTHVDMPFHFFRNGQTIADFDASFWCLKNPLLLEVTPLGYVIDKELCDQIEKYSNEAVDLLIVKTGMCHKRKEVKYWKAGYGFAPDVSECIRRYLPNVRIFGFDTISLTSYQDRQLGKEAHRAFLNPKSPILLLEDMDLALVDMTTIFKAIQISPLRLAHSDGLPCTVIAEIG